MTEHSRESASGASFGALWQQREPRDGRPAITMRFHDDWWHAIFVLPSGNYEVILGPMGLQLGVFRTMNEAKRAAEENARTRALNTLDTAREDIRRATVVLSRMGGGDV